LRWALFEAAQCAARRSSPDHAYYLEVAKRIDHNRACLSVARKLCRRAHHILRELGDATHSRRAVDRREQGSSTPPLDRPVRAPVIRPMPLRPAPAMLPPPALTRLAGLHRPSGRNSPRGKHPINHLVAGEIRAPR
jgi:hypothetical protein